MEEIGAAVCDGGLSGPAVMQELGLFDDIEQVALNTFVSEVEAACPHQAQTTSTTATTIESASSSRETNVYPPDIECNGRGGVSNFDYQAGAEGADTIEEAVQSFLGNGDTLVEGWDQSGGIVAIKDQSGRVSTYVKANQSENGWLVGWVMECVN